MKARTSKGLVPVAGIIISYRYPPNLSSPYKLSTTTEPSIVCCLLLLPKVYSLYLSSVPGRVLSLRVPISNIHSTTYAFYPDETHSSIRRVFTPHHAPRTKRHFCGFCGTPLSHWSEESPEEAEWVCINLSSLKSESVERLEDAGFLSGLADGTEESDESEMFRRDTSQSNPGAMVGREVTGNPWFEEIIEGSQLGRIKRRKGGARSSDGKAIVEYEITEFESGEGDGGTIGAGQRKLGSLGVEEDSEMKSG